MPTDYFVVNRHHVLQEMVNAADPTPTNLALCNRGASIAPLEPWKDQTNIEFSISQNPQSYWKLLAILVVERRIL